MTEAKRAALIVYLNDECRGDEYEIFSDDDFLALYPAVLGVDKEEIYREIKKLNAEGYLDVRYAEGGEYCIAVSEKGRRYEAEEISFRGGVRSLCRFSPFLSAFLGGVCGGVFAGLIFTLFRAAFF